MPLKKSKSNKAREQNIKEMIAAGHKPSQAVAAAYDVQRKAKAKRNRKRKDGSIR
ncbi:MAG TPA: hypothetical protein VIJ14_00380 [Rhabdochlamydiaceae bacterium]